MLCAALAAVLMAGAVGAVEVNVDFGTVTGPIRPVNGVGQPPHQGMPKNAWLLGYLKNAGIPYSRLHDVGGWRARGLYVDVPNIFRDFDADENDPKNYRFVFTDALMKHLVDSGIEPFYRLGVTIENFVVDGFPRENTMPPKDFAKWGRICEHIIRHYTEGWAGGFRYAVKYWEIWNEPDGTVPERNPMWGGSFEDYIRLYGVVAPYLKEKFPHLKIGGFACTGVGDGTGKVPHGETCTLAFLDAVKANGWPLDFYSFHSYAAPSEALRQIDHADAILTARGFSREKTERIFNEYQPYCCQGLLGSAKQAAGIAAELLGLQNGPCSVACVYDARCQTGDWSPLFNPFTQRPHKAYYALLDFNELRKRGNQVKVTHDGPETFHVVAAVKESSAAVMVANDSDVALPFELKAPGWRVESVRVTDDVRTDENAVELKTLPPHSFGVVTLQL